jgi:hypothetical protein
MLADQTAIRDETSKLDKTIEKLERYAEFLEEKVKEKTAQAGSKEIL